MTVPDNAKQVYETKEQRLDEAKKELIMVGNVAAEIYQSRMNEPNEAQLIRNFYYSVYHVIKGISVLDTAPLRKTDTNKSQKIKSPEEPSPGDLPTLTTLLAILPHPQSVSRWLRS